MPGKSINIEARITLGPRICTITPSDFSIVSGVGQPYGRTKDYPNLGLQRRRRSTERKRAGRSFQSSMLTCSSSNARRLIRRHSSRLA